MRYEIFDSVLVFYLDEPRREEPSKSTFSIEGIASPKEILTPLLDSFCRYCVGKLYKSQRVNLSAFIRPLLRYSQVHRGAWPSTSNEWQIFLLTFFQFYLTSEAWSQATPSGRIDSWRMTVCTALRYLRDDDVLPYDVVIPIFGEKRIKSVAADQAMLGEGPIKTVHANKETQKLLVNIDFSLPDADYLNTIEASCRKRIGLIKEVCLSHWDALMHDGVQGKKWADEISDADIERAIDSGVYKDRPQKKWGGAYSPLASPAHPRGHAWALALMRYLLTRGVRADCVSIETLRASPFFPTRILKGQRYNVLRMHTALQFEKYDELPSLTQLCRFARILSPLDAAVACCLLIIEHPEFTSESLQDAKLINTKGKSYLLVTDNRESTLFSIDKPRAGARKTVVLSQLSQRIIKNIIEWTAPVRDVLRRSNDKGWRYLFLGLKKAGLLGSIAPLARVLNCSEKTPSLTRLYPVLVENGLTAGQFDYRRIRNTMGVLRWFETGSIHEMSRRMGNSYRVVIEHYLPPALLHAWNTRIVRRFQNTLIILAAHDEDYLLEVTDFSTVSDLQYFIAQLIVDYSGNRSPLSKEVHERLNKGEFAKPQPDSAAPLGLLNIRLSANSLSYLYAFSELVLGKLTQEELHRVDTLSRLAPIQFVDLTRLIRHACENEETRAELSELLDLPRLRRVHELAVANQPTIRNRIFELAVRHHWGTY